MREDRTKMSETRESDRNKKPLGLSRPGRLELKKTVETGQVRQSFPHGRSKTVTVEIRKKRVAPVGVPERAETPTAEAMKPAAAQSQGSSTTPVVLYYWLELATIVIGFTLFILIILLRYIRGG